MAVRRSGRGKLYATIAAAIRQRIEEREWHPGERLPTLAQLAAEFQCSRATVREALSALRGQGLVEFRHGDGTFVRTAAVEMWMEPLEAAILLGASHVQQVIELSVAILAGIASFTAPAVALAASPSPVAGEDIGRSEIDLAILRTALFRLECAGDSADEAVASEIGFYLALAESLGNELMHNALRVLQEALRSCLRIAREAGADGTLACRRLFDAISAGDAQLAREVVYVYGDELKAGVQRRLSSGWKSDR